jgi:alpha-methylacyl-CoA racemase
MSEAYAHPHNQARGTFIEVGGAMQPAPAPRYSGTATATPRPAPMPGDQSDDILRSIGESGGAISELRKNCTIA